MRRTVDWLFVTDLGFVSGTFALNQGRVLFCIKDFLRLQRPLTLALSRRERELI